MEAFCAVVRAGLGLLPQLLLANELVVGEADVVEQIALPRRLPGKDNSGAYHAVTSARRMPGQGLSLHFFSFFFLSRSPTGGHAGADFLSFHKLIVYILNAV